MKNASILICCLMFLFGGQLTAQLSKLQVSENGRFLTREDGSPFVWIGDTNWFFAKLPPSTIDSLLDKRNQQGYNVMMVSCREKLYNGDGPGGTTAPNEAWWAYLDEYIAKCEKRNMYVAITLGWWGKAMRGNETHLYEHGKWVGNRYKDNSNIIWLTLGEAGGHLRKSTIPQNNITALVKGIRDGDTGDKLLTIHADYKRGTSIDQAHAALCDFNNWQTSQWCCLTDLPRKDERTWTVWDAISYDYNTKYDGKSKPTLDIEAWYENNKDFCGTTPFNIRRRAYFTMLAGAFGHSYGAGGIWDGLLSGEKCSGNAWQAIDYEGAEHIGYAGKFFRALGDGFLKLKPAQEVILSDNSDDYDYHIQASMASDESFIIAYSASGSPYEIDVSIFSKKQAKAAWYNPRTNEFNEVFIPKRSANGKSAIVDPPGSSTPGNDWILVLGQGPLFQSLQQ